MEYSYNHTDNQVEIPQNSKSQSNSCDNKRQKYYQKAKEYKQFQLLHETASERDARLAKKRAQYHKRKAEETNYERLERLNYNAACKKAKRSVENQSEKSERLKKK